MCRFKGSALSFKYLCSDENNFSAIWLWTFYNIRNIICSFDFLRFIYFCLMCVICSAFMFFPWRPEEGSGNQAQVLCKNNNFFWTTEESLQALFRIVNQILEKSYGLLLFLPLKTYWSILIMTHRLTPSLSQPARIPSSCLALSASEKE